jgi:hypothetical protein
MHVFDSIRQHLFVFLLSDLWQMSGLGVGELAVGILSSSVDRELLASHRSLQNESKMRTLPLQ